MYFERSCRGGMDAEYAGSPGRSVSVTFVVKVYNNVNIDRKSFLKTARDGADPV